MSFERLPFSFVIICRIWCFQLEWAGTFIPGTLSIVKQCDKRKCAFSNYELNHSGNVRYLRGDFPHV